MAKVSTAAMATLIRKMIWIVARTFVSLDQDFTGIFDDTIEPGGGPAATGPRGVS